MWLLQSAINCFTKFIKTIYVPVNLKTYISFNLHSMVHSHFMILQLKNASEEELSDIKRETIKNVLKQIRAQQSILEKQARAERRDEELANRISKLVKNFHSQEEQIAEQSKVDEELIELIKEQNIKILYRKMKLLHFKRKIKY